jgi:hypothetical protein
MMSSRPADAANDAIRRAADFLIAGAVEPDEARASELQRVAAGAMLEAAQLLSGYTGDKVPVDAFMAIRDEVLALVRDHFERLAKVMAPALVGIRTESEAVGIMKEQFARSTPIKQ